MTPKLRRLYRTDGDWQSVLAAALELPPNLQEKTHDIWEKNVELAGARGVTLDPQQFAEEFVDHHWQPN